MLPGALKPGLTYTFRYEASDGAVGYGERRVSIADGPKSGDGAACSYEKAKTYTELDGGLTVSCIGFEANSDVEALPLRYAVTYQTLRAGEEASNLVASADASGNDERMLLAEPSTAPVVDNLANLPQMWLWMKIHHDI